jgi:hypothetical protein
MTIPGLPGGAKFRRFAKFLPSLRNKVAVCEMWNSCEILWISKRKMGNIPVFKRYLRNSGNLSQNVVMWWRNLLAQQLAALVDCRCWLWSNKQLSELWVFIVTNIIIVKYAFSFKKNVAKYGLFLEQMWNNDHNLTCEIYSQTPASPAQY